MQKKRLDIWVFLILSGRSFKINLQPSKQNLFRATNAILRQIISTKNPNAKLSLMHSFCIPILLYGLDKPFL